MTKKIHDISDVNHLSHSEVNDIIHDKHVSADQLNLLAAHAKHVNAERKAEISELDKRLARIAARLKELEARRSH